MGLFFTFINFYLLVVRFNTVTTSLRKETQKIHLSLFLFFASSLLSSNSNHVRRLYDDHFWLCSTFDHKSHKYRSISSLLRSLARFWEVCCWDWKLDEWENIQRKSFDATTINDFFPSSCWWFCGFFKLFSPVWRKLRSIDCFWLARRHQKSNSTRTTKIMLYFSVSSSSSPFWMRKSIAIYVCGVYIGESMSRCCANWSNEVARKLGNWKVCQTDRIAQLFALLFLHFDVFDR